MEHDLNAKVKPRESGKDRHPHTHGYNGAEQAAGYPLNLCLYFLLGRRGRIENRVSVVRPGL
jgi:hypothetical protein